MFGMNFKMIVDYKLSIKLMRSREKVCVRTCIGENNWKQKKI